MMTPFQSRVAQILGATLQPYGFALGGGQALQAHKIIDGPSKDLDNYSTSQDPDVFDSAERDLVAALREHGLSASVVRRDSWFGRSLSPTQTRMSRSVSVQDTTTE